jgi:hypothetical protein
MKTTLPLLAICCTAASLQASVVDFNQNTWNVGSGITGSAQVRWWGDAPAGGHIYMNAWNNDDFLYFTTPTYINSFNMTARFWSGQNAVIPGKIKVAAYDSGNAELWSSVVDLTDNGAWNSWETVNLGIDNVSSLKFFSPNIKETGFSTFCPSVDDLRINERPEVLSLRTQNVPESGSGAALLFLGASCLMGFGAIEKRRTANVSQK